MRILVGTCFAGATLTDFDELAPGRGACGVAVWSPVQLLRDLELRLGLGQDSAANAVRVAAWTKRVSSLAGQGRFYSASFEVDALGTGNALLELRDSLVEAGSIGQAIPGGGQRIDAIVELEGLAEPALPSGFVDRLRRVEHALSTWRIPLYSEVGLAEPRALYSTCWASILQSLERLGARVFALEAVLPGAALDSDLGKVQAALRDARETPRPQLAGDGTFVLLRAETEWEVAHATAALLASTSAEGTVVIRPANVSALESSLPRYGTPTQGWSSVSRWRAALQVLPLALELGFEPKDPQRVLELVTLPQGPFWGASGRLLARALADSPGIGSPAWLEAKARIATFGSDATTPDARNAELTAKIADWLELRGHDAVAGAPKQALLAVVERTRQWLISRLLGAPEDATLLTAIRQSGALQSALEGDPRETLSLVEMRRLTESVIDSDFSVALVPEEAGRAAHVDDPSGLLVARPQVVWWSFANRVEGRARVPWRRSERASLARVGVHFRDDKLFLAERSKVYRRAVLAATERLLLVCPRFSAGEALAPHPLWDEIVARLELDEAALARITVTPHELRVSSSLRRPAFSEVEPALLPGGRDHWRVPPEHVTALDHYSSQSLAALLGCPFQWALSYRAGLQAGGHALPPLFMLNGQLGHRLIELLHQQGAFALSNDALRERAETEIDRLIEREGSSLLRAGMAFERNQLRAQLVASAVELARALGQAGLRIIAVEHPVDVPWQGGKLEGRINLLVANDAGAEAIIDMKWGIATYREQLQAGQALQLAVYAFAHRVGCSSGRTPDASYFSLKQTRMFGLRSELLPTADEVHGPSLDDTWARIERTMPSARALAESGTFPVTGIRKSLPLLESLGVPRRDHAEYFAHAPDSSCKYCGFDALCGKRWEVLS